MDQLKSPNKKRGAKTTHFTLTPTGTRNGMRDATTADSNRLTNRTSFLLASNNRQRGSRNRIASRMSLLPPLAMPPPDTLQQSEADNSDIELNLLYDKYLQAVCSEILMKKKVEEHRTELSDQLVKVMAERDLAMQNFTKMNLRANDVKNLTYLQNDIDVQGKDADACIDELMQKHMLEEKLRKLKYLLEPLDSLRCKDIVIPENCAEVEDILKTLKEIDTVLTVIKDSIGSRGETLHNFIATLDEFMRKYREIENIQANFEDALGKLQALVLKATSLSLRYDDL